MLGIFMLVDIDKGQGKSDASPNQGIEIQNSQLNIPSQH